MNKKEKETPKDKLFAEISRQIDTVGDDDSNHNDCNMVMLDEPVVDISFGEDTKFNYDIKKFKTGIEEMSYYAGKIAVLMSMGVSPDIAVNFVDDLEVTKIASESSIKVAELNSKFSSDMSKKQSFEDKKNSI